MAVKSFRDSIAWQRAMDLSHEIYQVTRTFPKEEIFGLTNQLRRASVSIASNIAEGQGRLTQGEFLHFLGMARGSAFEVETQLEIAKREGFANVAAIERAQSIASEVVRILNAVITSLRKQKPGPGRKT
jgi:four helix bundle protein